MTGVKRKLLAVLAVFLGGTAAFLVPVTPEAEAWSYCEPVVQTAGKVNFWPSQGYCGARKEVSKPPGWNLGDEPRCFALFNIQGLDNYAASISNQIGGGVVVTLYSGSNCDGWSKYLAPGNSDGDLYPDNLYRTGSSIKFH